MGTSHYRAESIGHDFWTIFDRRGREVGTVRGGGPTAATRFKVISTGNVAMNPDTAPGCYFRSLLDAAMLLAAPDVIDEATREIGKCAGKSIGSVAETFGGDWRASSRGDQNFGSRRAAIDAVDAAEDVREDMIEWQRQADAARG